LVHIKRIDLRGFKTFGRKVSLALDKGLTVVTGPNGSGKSNVMDAVKFALGELSPKELRGSTLSDLIHKGSIQLGQRSAHVSVQFDNSDRRLPIDSEAVTISREFRRGGEGIYRLNGKRISRKQLTDVLSSGDIQVSGHNIVPQHAVTRLAEVTSEERRKIIEDMIGIAVYDTKKNEAQVQLQQADLNLRVASARIDEVRMRVESLERERNDYLRYTFLKSEVNRLQAQLLSNRMSRLKTEIAGFNAEVDNRQRDVESVKKRREELLTIRSQLEGRRRDFEEKTVDKGSQQLFEVERNIGDVSAKIASIKTEIESGEANLRTLMRQKEDLAQHTDQLNRSVEETRAEIRRLKSRRDRLSSAMDEKRKLYEKQSEALTEMRQQLGQNTKRIEVVEREADGLIRQLVRFNALIKGSSTKLDLLSSHMHTLETRKAEFQSLIEDVQARTEELSKLKREEESRLEEIERKLSEYASLKETRRKEIIDANEVAKKARVSIVEFETQRKLAEGLTAEQRALSKIEEMGRTGAIRGVLGRLEDLIHFKEEHRKAVEAASGGWMKALIVEDLDTAVACVESLKRTKLGRIKIIPLVSVATVRTVEDFDETPGVLGRLVDFIDCDDDLVPAVKFVFGDTVLASSQKGAFLASLKNLRAAVVSGDLYEPGGGMESGYYREPLDLESLIPKDSALESLDETVESLESLVQRGESDVIRLDSEVVSLRESRITSQNMIASMQREMEGINASLSRGQKSLSSTIKRLASLSKEVDKEKVFLSSITNQRALVQDKLNTLEKEKTSLRVRAKQSQLADAEAKYAILTKELNELNQEQIAVESRQSTLESTLSTIMPSFDQARIQSKGLDRQAEKTRADMESSRVRLDEVKRQLAELESQREKLSSSLTSVREKRGEFEAEMKKIEVELKSVFDRYEPLNAAMMELNSQIKERTMQVSYLETELRALGYKQLFDVKTEEVKKVESTLNVIKNELESIGAVNQLAAVQYEEVKNNYKQLSTRINELEREKFSILNFMNELEKKKFDTFMKAFESVNKNFQEIFGTISNGGSGKLLLEHPEDPFKGGVDVYLRFPGKAELTIGSASGGEKSVATVCFILALQAIHPMPFYIFDEIDAHLDAVNSQRLADLLRQRSQGSQFVVISLKDTTISRANKIYGVYIQDGVSQMVSLPLPEAR